MTTQKDGDTDAAAPDAPEHDPANKQNLGFYNPKGIGSNRLLTMAAAAVPLIIVGIAGLRTALGARKPRR